MIWIVLQEVLIWWLIDWRVATYFLNIFLSSAFVRILFKSECSNVPNGLNGFDDASGLEDSISKSKSINICVAV